MTTSDETEAVSTKQETIAEDTKEVSDSKAAQPSIQPSKDVSTKASSEPLKEEDTHTPETNKDTTLSNPTTLEKTDNKDNVHNEVTAPSLDNTTEKEKTADETTQQAPLPITAPAPSDTTEDDTTQPDKTQLEEEKISEDQAPLQTNERETLPVVEEATASEDTQSHLNTIMAPQALNDDSTSQPTSDDFSTPEKAIDTLTTTNVATTNTQQQTRDQEQIQTQPNQKAKQAFYKNGNPIILVHGFNGFTDDIKPSVHSHYWGGDKVNISEFLNENGYETYEASVSAFGSNYDRAVELYYYIKGGTVDYGAAHAEKYGHERYGKTYEGIYKDW